eukprot:784693-Pyramimonas_sp.AAC.1
MYDLYDAYTSPPANTLSRSPSFAHRAPRCAARGYLRALARPPRQGCNARSAIIFAPLGVT